MVKRWFFVCLLLFGFGTWGSESKAQVSFSTYADSFELLLDTVSYGTNYNYNLYVINTGNAAFSGTIVFYIKVNNGISDSIFTLPTATIPAHDSLFITLTDNISPARYGGGVNLVVIWPEAPFFGSVTSDSFVKQVFVDTLTASKSPDFLRSIRLFPNPTADFLKIEGSLAEGKVEETLLVNSAGVLVRRWNGLPEEISCSAFSNGAYSLVFVLQNGSQFARKVIVAH